MRFGHLTDDGQTEPGLGLFGIEPRSLIAHGHERPSIFRSAPDVDIPTLRRSPDGVVDEIGECPGQAESFTAETSPPRRGRQANSRGGGRRLFALAQLGNQLVHIYSSIGLSSV